MEVVFWLVVLVAPALMLVVMVLEAARAFASVKWKVTRSEAPVAREGTPSKRLAFSLADSRLAVGAVAVVALALLPAVVLLPTLGRPEPGAYVAKNLVENGDFSRELASWKLVAVKEGLGGSPRFGADKAVGLRVAELDVSKGAEAYLEQEIVLPKSGAAWLNVKTFAYCGSGAGQVTVYISVFDANDKAFPLDRFQPLVRTDRPCAPDAKSYDLSRFSGQKVRLRLGAASFIVGPEPEVARARFSDVVVVAPGN